jgi:hypothetical protein
VIDERTGKALQGNILGLIELISWLLSGRIVEYRSEIQSELSVGPKFYPGAFPLREPAQLKS